jgi:hypothetical protein
VRDDLDDSDGQMETIRNGKELLVRKQVENVGR